MAPFSPVNAWVTTVPLPLRRIEERSQRDGYSIVLRLHFYTLRHTRCSRLSIRQERSRTPPFPGVPTISNSSPTSSRLAGRCDFANRTVRCRPVPVGAIRRRWLPALGMPVRQRVDQKVELNSGGRKNVGIPVGGTAAHVTVPGQGKSRASESRFLPAATGDSEFVSG
jgi:hypothetical protein